MCRIDCESRQEKLPSKPPAVILAPKTPIAALVNTIQTRTTDRSPSSCSFATSLLLAWSHPHTRMNPFIWRDTWNRNGNPDCQLIHPWDTNSSQISNVTRLCFSGDWSSLQSTIPSYDISRMDYSSRDLYESPSRRYEFTAVSDLLHCSFKWIGILKTFDFSSCGIFIISHRIQESLVALQPPDSIFFDLPSAFCKLSHTRVDAEGKVVEKGNHSEIQSA